MHAAHVDLEQDVQNLRILRTHTAHYFDGFAVSVFALMGFDAFQKTWLPWRSILPLEHKFQTKLQKARRRGLENLSECRRIDITLRQREITTVKDINRFRPKLEGPRFRQ